MKFSISFKYSNVTFKNKETKETVTYETKASEGNTFTFDNVDEDVVIGMLKGIKDKKASQLFAYDDLRTNFINVMARNKCKELYDKLDMAEWKIEDVSISNITIKDLEFTKPTMNARETITVESKKMKINESEEPVIFKRDPNDGEVIAFFPETMHDGSVNMGNIMCYAHNGQSSEASVEYFQKCEPCRDESEYADLLAELEDYFMQDPDCGDIKLKVMKKPYHGRSGHRKPMWPTR